MAYNILVVDDSQVARNFVIKILQMAKIDLGEIFQAGDGKEALDTLNRSWIDLVFADINMPVMNGIEMVDKMAKMELMDSIPVVIISTERSVTRIHQLKNKGISAYLSKPLTPSNVKTVVDDILGPSVQQKIDS